MQQMHTLTTKPQDETHAPPHRPHIIRNLLIFLAVLSCVVAVSHSYFPYPYPEQIGPKLRYFHRNKNDYSVVFIGSSHILRQVDAKLLDQQLALCGHHITSFNMGFLYADGRIITQILREILAMEPGRLKYVVLEYRKWRAGLGDVNINTEYLVWQHTLRDTLSSTRDCLALNRPIWKRLDLAKSHLALMLTRYFRIGKGMQIVRSYLGEDETTDEMMRTLEENQGFSPLSENAPNLSALKKHQRRVFIADIKSYIRRVRILQKIDADRLPVRRLPEAHYVRDQISLLREAGMVPIYLISPEPRRDLTVRISSIRKLVPTLFAFGSPREYPQLFRIDSHFDRSHLNIKGARTMTLLLANKFCDYLAILPSK